MAFRSEQQRKAVFAQMKKQTLQTGARAGYRGAQTIKRKGPGLLKRGQEAFRSFQRKSPIGSELAIAIPATIIAAAGISKMKAITSLASRGALVRGGAEMGAAIAADAAVRRFMGGPGKKRKDAPVLPSLGASLVAEGGYRYAKLGKTGRAALHANIRSGKYIPGIVKTAGHSLAGSALRHLGRLGRVAGRAVL